MIESESSAGARPRIASAIFRLSESFRRLPTKTATLRVAPIVISLEEWIQTGEAGPAIAVRAEAWPPSGRGTESLTYHGISPAWPEQCRAAYLTRCQPALRAVTPSCRLRAARA